MENKVDERMQLLLKAGYLYPRIKDLSKLAGLSPEAVRAWCHGQGGRGTDAAMLRALEALCQAK